MNNALELARIAVLDTDGQPVELGTLWRDRAVVLIFVRQFG